VTAAAALISVAIAPVLGLAAEAWAAGAACCAPTICNDAALLLIPDAANAAAPAAAAAFPALGPIELFATSSARVFPAFSFTALPSTSVTAGAASSAAALTAGVVAPPPAVAASRWVAVLVDRSLFLGPGGLRLVLAPLRARSSAVSASKAARSSWTARRLLSAAGSWVSKTLLTWASAEPGLGRSTLGPVVWAGCHTVVVGVWLRCFANSARRRGLRARRRPLRPLRLRLARVVLVGRVPRCEISRTIPRAGKTGPKATTKGFSTHYSDPLRSAAACTSQLPSRVGSRATHARTLLPASTGFCAVWVCISKIFFIGLCSKLRAPRRGTSLSPFVCGAQTSLCSYKHKWHRS
jgi:hypothetical protein